MDVTDTVVRPVAMVLYQAIEGLEDKQLKEVIAECMRMTRHSWWVSWALHDAIESIARNERQLRGDRRLAELAKALEEEEGE